MPGRLFSRIVTIELLFFWLLILWLLFFSGCSAAPPGDAADGKKWYMMNNCQACHGAHGDDGQAVNIAGISMGFGSFVRKLRKTDAPTMPPFPESKISEQDAADIYAYLQSLKPRQTPGQAR